MGGVASSGWDGRSLSPGVADLVTVWADNASLADAAATSLFVAGPREWPDIARRMGIERVMLVDRDGVIYITPDMRDIITLAKDVTAKVRIVELQ